MSSGVRREAPLGPEGFSQIFPVSRETLTRLETYAGLLTRWSARTNLVSRDSLADLWRRHVLDSAQLYRFVPNATRSLIDLGSGAGLPGLILTILGVRGVELVEADQRKAAFLREAARITAADVTIRPCRIEEMLPHPVDVVTARACAPLERLLGLAERFLASNTVCLFPKGERFEEELTLARKAWTMMVSVEPSLSDRRGVILRLHQVAREPRQP
jgi:16S rRNA (guanine527-N7)-methyltransferase